MGLKVSHTSASQIIIAWWRHIIYLIRYSFLSRPYKIYLQQKAPPQQTQWIPKQATCRHSTQANRSSPNLSEYTTTSPDPSNPKFSDLNDATGCVRNLQVVILPSRTDDLYTYYVALHCIPYCVWALLAGSANFYTYIYIYTPLPLQFMSHGFSKHSATSHIT